VGGKVLNSKSSIYPTRQSNDIYETLARTCERQSWETIARAHLSPPLQLELVIWHDLVVVQCSDSGRGVGGARVGEEDVVRVWRVLLLLGLLHDNSSMPHD